MKCFYCRFFTFGLFLWKQRLIGQHEVVIGQLITNTYNSTSYPEVHSVCSVWKNNMIALSWLKSREKLKFQKTSLLLNPHWLIGWFLTQPFRLPQGGAAPRKGPRHRQLRRFQGPAESPHPTDQHRVPLQWMYTARDEWVVFGSFQSPLTLWLCPSQVVSRCGQTTAAACGALAKRWSLVCCRWWTQASSSPVQVAGEWRNFVSGRSTCRD